MKSMLQLGALAALVLSAPVAAAAQEAPKSWHEEQIADLEQMKGKFLALADAFPEDNYDWRPMEGTRSVREVMALAAAEGFLFPNMWGAEAASGVAENFPSEIGRLTELSKAELISEIERGLDHMMMSIDLDEMQLGATATWFGGRSVRVESAIGLALIDMHEHLGQSIAYARTNHIVPPWSMGGN